MNLRVLFVLLMGVMTFGLKGQESQGHAPLVNAHSSPQLFNTENLQSREFISFQLQNRAEGLFQKAVIAPFLKGKTHRFLKQTHLNFVQYNKISTIGLGYGVDLSSSKSAQNEEINPKSFQINFGFNLSLFPNWGSPSRDSNQDSLRDNFYAVKSKSAQLGFSFQKKNKFGIQVVAHYIQSREREVEGTKEVTSAGYSLSLAKRIKKANLQELIPWNRISLDIGLSVEHLIPIKNGSELSNGNAYQLAVSPFVNLGLNSIVNLKLNVPFHLIEGKQDERGFGSFFQLYFQLP